MQWSVLKHALYVIKRTSYFILFYRFSQKIVTIGIYTDCSELYGTLLQILWNWYILQKISTIKDIFCKNMMSESFIFHLEEHKKDFRYGTLTIKLSISLNCKKCVFSYDIRFSVNKFLY